MSTAAPAADWDPLELRRSGPYKPPKACARRIRKDIIEVHRDPLPGICVWVDEADMSKIHVLMTGPFGTPYEGGLFYFIMACPDDYPTVPPKVRLMTTSGGRVRFGPNLYRNGKVCLSILGTWSGPSWSATQTISSVLLSIQSLMDAKPFHLEPGFEKAPDPRDVEDYNHCIRHETIRVAVCEMLDSETMRSSLPSALRTTSEMVFTQFLENYRETCTKYMHMDGRQMRDPFGEPRGVFRYGEQLERINRIAARIGPPPGEAGATESKE